MRRIWMVLLGLVVSAPAFAETVTLVADPWCPYNCDVSDKRPGFMVEIAQQAFSRHGIEVRYVPLPWTRAISEVREGKYTALTGASVKDVPDFVFPAVPQGKMRNAFYVLEESAWRFTGLDSLAHVSLGVIADYGYSDALDAYIREHKNDPRHIQPVNGNYALEQNVRKLLAGRIEALVEARHVMDYYLMRHPAVRKIVLAGELPPSSQDPLFIAFSPNEPNAKKYAEIIAKETQAMRQSGELQQILSHYGVADWQEN